MPQLQTAVVRSKDGRFFNVPESVLKRYRVKPDKLSADEKAPAKSKTNGYSKGNGKGTVQVIINVSSDGRVQTISGEAATPNGEWIYEPPAAGRAMEWGDDFDPTGGMSSAARRG